jgi:hypothetical protein
VNANLLHGYGLQEVHVVRRFEDDCNSETPGGPPIEGLFTWFFP